MKLHAPFTVDGQPVLGTYVAQTVEDLKQVREVGMNIVIGGHEHLDPNTEQGRFCRENGIKILHHMVQHLYGKPRLLDRVTPEQRTIRLFTEWSSEIPKSGVIQLGDELIGYGSTDRKELRDCERGCQGTTPAEHRPGEILFWPEECAAEVEKVRSSPNLWGYYVLDDSPGDAISALRAMYRVIKRLDPGHPVTAGYGSAGSLCNFGPDVCDIMLIYWYPVDPEGHYHRMLTSHEVQWMMGAARAQVPGMPFVGVYQAFDAAENGTGKGLINAEQLREQIEDFVREGCCGLIAFLCAAPPSFPGWAKHENLRDVIHETHREIRETGGLKIPPEPDEMKRERVQPVGLWKRPKDVPGVIPVWYVMAPFHAGEEKRLDAVFPPERQIDLNAVYDGKSGPVRWIRRLSYGGVVGLGELFGPHSYTSGCTAYATCTVTSSKRRDAQLRLGSDDDAIVWLDGREVWRHEGERGVQRDDDVLDVTLPQGTTRILVKVYNRKGMWGFFMRFTHREGRPLQGLGFDPAGPG